MATPAEKLAASLEILHERQRTGRRVFRSSEFSRTHRDRLRSAGFLADIIRGWVLATSPEEQPGTSTSWFSAFWEFCARYAEDRFGDEWWLSPEVSLRLHAENWSVPSQVVIHSVNGTNNAVSLPFGSSVFDLKDTKLLPDGAVTQENNLRFLSAEAALVRAPVALFRSNPVDIRAVMAGFRDVTPLTRALLAAGKSAAAGRIAGAFRAMGRKPLADAVLRAMQSAGYDVREDNPFLDQPAISNTHKHQTPLANRIQELWSAGRADLQALLPAPGEQTGARHQVLDHIEERYAADAYHSLSIEGYVVSPELIERVRSGNWDPDHEPDRSHRDALAARGYWLAFQAVKDSLGRILEGADPAGTLKQDHGDWYRALFQPSVAAGIISPAALAGYRNGSVYIRSSRHVPPRHQTVLDGMEAVFESVSQEESLGVAGVLAHWLTGFIHPYSDGNGRMARFLMNALLVSGGYPWTVIPVERRTDYMAALEAASVRQDLEPFGRLVAELVERSSRNV